MCNYGIASVLLSLSQKELCKQCKCNTPGVWLPHLHLHFINISIIHPFMSLYHMKHVFETLQRIVMFHVCCFFYEMKSVQHLSATCATHLVKQGQLILCNKIMKHVRHDYETIVTFHVFFIVSVHTMLDSCVTKVWCG